MRAGIPALLLAEVVTPHVKKYAQRAGYVAAVPLASPAKILYRRIGALLQSRRRPDDRAAAVVAAAEASARGRLRAGDEQFETGAFGKPRLQ